MLTWATIGFTLSGESLPVVFGLIPYIALAGVVVFVVWMAYFRGRLLPNNQFRNQEIAHAFRMATLRHYGSFFLLRSPALLAAVVVYTMALRLFGVEASFLSLLGYLPVIFFAAAVPTPMRAAAITSWVVLFPENEGQMAAFGFVQHNFFILFNALIGVVFRFCCNFGPATSGWTVFDNDWTGSPIMPSDNPFKWRQFEPGLILLCVRWYLRYAVSYRDLEEMMRERGLCVDHTTIYRWVQRYAPEIDKRCRPFLRRTTDSYRIDETYVRVGGAWHYLYRGVDSNGDTLDFLLRATRDRNAAIAFFRKTVGASHTTPPRVVNVDKNPAYPIAFEAIKHEGFFRPRSSLRQCKYLNNVIKQDHRFIKRRTRPMLGFKQFTTAWRTVRGIEMMHALRKGQARWMAKGDVVGQTRLIHKVVGLAV